MPCNHKFQNYLNLEHLDFKPTTLIVGTFNPEWPVANSAQWFYGRTAKNYFWDVLPRLYNKGTLINASPTDWKNFCREHLIAITDLIFCIEDADITNDEHNNWLSNYSDSNIVKKFGQQIPVEVREILKKNPTIKNVYLTRSIGDIFWKNRWKSVKQYCDANKIECKELLTPSGYAYYQHGKFKKANPSQSLTLSEFILKRWSEKWHKL